MRATGALLGFTISLCAGLATARAQSGENGFPAAPDRPPPGNHRAAAGHAAGKHAPAAAHSPTASHTAAPPKPAEPVIPAKVLFGAAKVPAPTAPRAIGSYAAGCLAGATALPVDGPAWQAMRLSRNRNWGHPALVGWLERFASEARRHDGWPGLLVGDMAQPRGGPMLTGHASHQIGLDADIWLTPMPDHRLSRDEREKMSAVSMLKPDSLAVDPERWDDRRARIIMRAAKTAEVERIFVHPAIKKALCESADRLGPERSWLAKVRAYWGHYYHFHVRMACPKDSAGCRPQAPVPVGDGCGAELTDWLKRIKPRPAPPKPPGPPKPPPPPMTLDKLPAECRVVLETGVSKGITRASAAGGAAGAAPAAPTAAPAGQR